MSLKAVAFVMFCVVGGFAVETGLAFAVGLGYPLRDVVGYAIGSVAVMILTVAFSKFVR